MVCNYIPKGCRLTTAFLSIALVILLMPACTDEPKFITDVAVKTDNTAMKKAPSNIYAGACIDVYVHVLGDLLPDSTAFLYTLPSVEFDDVMHKVQEDTFTRTFVVDASQEFKILCLEAGHYAIMIPTSSYNRSVGYPLPNETRSENLSIAVVFQGGNYLYAVGVFSVSKNQSNLSI